MRVLLIGGVTVFLDDEREYLETRWPDGLTCPAIPQPGRTTWQDTIDHELGHTWLAVTLDGLPWSPTLRKVAEQRAGRWDGRAPTDAEVAEEEARVLAWQKVLGNASRPW